jgi:hypothetical protein
MPNRTRTAAAILILAIACGGDTAGAEAFCNTARELAKADPSEGEKNLETMRQLRDEAPDEIADAVETILDATEEAIDKQDPSILQDPELQDASDDLDAYLEDNCEAPE